MSNAHNYFPEEIGYLTVEDQEKLSKLLAPIPANESERLKFLRQTELLDSAEEQSFDRFTTLVQRLFQVPIAFISLVDVDRVWLKSKSGLDANETPRDIAFCSYTVLPENPEVFVIPNMTTDPRFANNPLVAGPAAHLRFYAGAAIIVDGARLGSLCILDVVPHENFSMVDRMNLMDLGEAVSSLVRQKRESVLNLDRERMRVVLDTMHNVRTPLMTLGLATSLLESDRNAIKAVLSKDSKSVALADSFDSSVEAISSSVNTLKLRVEQSMQLGGAVIANTGNPSDIDSNQIDDQVQRSKSCNVLDSIESTKLLFLSLNAAFGPRIVWNIDKEYFNQGPHKSFPEVIKVVLLTVLEKAASGWRSCRVSSRFQGDSVVDGCFACRFDAPIFGGHLVIEVQMSDVVPETVISTTGLKFPAIERLLRDVNGSSRSVVGEAGEVLFEVNIPCTLSTTPEVAVRTRTSLKPSVQASTDAAAGAESKSGSQEGGTMAATPQQPVPSARVRRSLQPGANGTRPAAIGAARYLPTKVIADKTEKLRVLIVEDAVPIQKMMKKWLERYDCVVTSALNGKLGLELLKSQRFDIMFCDFLMPVMLGIEMMGLFTSWRKESPENSNNEDMLAIGMSATASLQEQDDAFDNGMHFFFSKPVNTYHMTMLLSATREGNTLADIVDAVCEMAHLPTLEEEEHWRPVGVGAGGDGDEGEGDGGPDEEDAADETPAFRSFFNRRNPA